MWRIFHSSGVTSFFLGVLASVCFSSSDAWLTINAPQQSYHAAASTSLMGSTTSRSTARKSTTGATTIVMISSGFSFEDGKNQILVSVQKPFGIVLEQDDQDGTIYVAEVDESGSAGRAGVRVGDMLVAVQNASVESADLDSVLNFIGNGPKVMNLRLVRESS